MIIKSVPMVCQKAIEKGKGGWKPPQIVRKR
jgi:hypothetical protein